MKRRRNVFVVGPDAAGLESLRRFVPDCAFHELLPYARVKSASHIDARALVAEAEMRLSAARVRPDAIIGYWDFPTTALVPLLCDRLGLPSATLAGAVACEHKYWSRLAQRAVGCETPRFAWIDPFAQDPLRGIEITYPFWLKPVKSYGSHLAFLLRGPQDAAAALSAIRAGVGWLAEPFGAMMRHVAVPDEVRRAGAYACLVEEHVEGRLCTLEGYVRGGEVVPYAVVDSFKDEMGLSFGRYQYPSSLPERVKARMAEMASSVFPRIGYGDAPFNIEFIYDEARDRLVVLEINPRLSESHAALFEKVDGAPHLRLLAELALGREPRLPHRQGEARCAARFYLRAYDDGVVSRMPSPAALRDLERRYAGTRLHLRVKLGQQLSQLANPSYSYELGTVDVGGRDEAELFARFRDLSESLEMEIAPVPCAIA